MQLGRAGTTNSPVPRYGKKGAVKQYLAYFHHFSVCFVMASGVRLLSPLLLLATLAVANAGDGGEGRVEQCTTLSAKRGEASPTLPMTHPRLKETDRPVEQVYHSHQTSFSPRTPSLQSSLSHMTCTRCCFPALPPRRVQLLSASSFFPF